jgi:F0F1-type ATP synthase assembly protein I
MSDSKDYLKMTPKELSAAEKKLKRSEIISAVLVGFLVGIMIYGIAKNGFGFLYIFIPVLLILGIVKNSQKQKSDLKKIRVEIESRKNI